MDRYFNIHGITVRLSADHQTLLEQTSQELRFFESEPLPSTQISVSVIEQDDLNGYKTNWAAFHEEVESETHWINQSIASIMNIPKRTVQLYLVPSTPVDAAVVILFGVIGFYVQLELSLQKEIAAFHGASLVKEGKGILLLGKTNSGKTSLSYRMSDLGVSYVS